MDIKYVMADPTGNITALVETLVPTENQPEIAEAILEKEPTCEQVGYILWPMDGSDISLRMAGGEFCGNATMSTAAYFCKKHDLKDGEKKTVKVKVVGTSGVLAVDVENRGGVFYTTIEMPKPLKISDVKFIFEGHNYIYPVVEFDSISHAIIENDLPVYMPEACIKMWCDSLRAKGLGLMMLYNNNTSLRPLVYVTTPETMFWESSCASGTTAVGVYFAKKTGKPVKMELDEPGGKLVVETFADGKVKLSGKVVI